MTGYGKIEMSLRIRADKMDAIRAMFAGIVMKRSSKCAENWEVTLTNLFNINMDRRTLINETFFKANYSPPLSTPTGIDLICSRRKVWVSENPEEWLFNIAPYLENGFIEITRRNEIVNNTAPPQYKTTLQPMYLGYAITGGNLYETVKYDGMEIGGQGTNFKIGRKITIVYPKSGSVIFKQVREEDKHYMKWFIYQ